MTFVLKTFSRYPQAQNMLFLSQCDERIASQALVECSSPVGTGLRISYDAGQPWRLFTCRSNASSSVGPKATFPI